MEHINISRNGGVAQGAIETGRDARMISVLDKGFVRLVESVGGDLSVVRAARVSYNADWRPGKGEGSDEKLLRYLMRNKHTSPFEAVVLTFEVKAPIFVFRQWHRHRTWSYNEMSARYTELPEEYYVPAIDAIGEQSATNKQMRVIGGEARGERVVDLEKYSQACDAAFDQYRQFLTNGWPRELARMVLPLSTYSRMFATVDLHNLLHFLNLRMHAHAQYEIRVYAEALCTLASAVAPVCIEAWKESRIAVAS